MKNNFPWQNDKDFIDTCRQNPDVVSDIILNTLAIKKFKTIYSAGLILHHAYTSLIKQLSLYEKFNSEHVNHKNFDNLQEYQTEMNFLIFSFVQCVLPFRDHIRNGNVLCKDDYKHFFKESDIFDFFISLRNIQTHAYTPVIQWFVNKNIIKNETFSDVRISDRSFLLIAKYYNSDENKRFNRKKIKTELINFSNGGYDYITKNHKTPFYSLQGDMYEHMKTIALKTHEIFINNYGNAMDECEHYLSQRNNYWQEVVDSAFLHKTTLNTKATDDAEKPKSKYENILREFGGIPQLMTYLDVNTLPSLPIEKEKDK